MPEAPDAATAWQWLLERRPHTRSWTVDELAEIAHAAHAEPLLRALYPFPSHGGLHFLNGLPGEVRPAERLPHVLYGPPPYKVYSSDFTELGEVATAEEAVALLARQLPPELRRPRQRP
ncbi:DUF6193 family natural product biosynthesis protein [Streptomyces sp. NBC_00631]|uniref:DUF6193 family natural product biosynthesis protein n=1 Tax=Streptomyces sp. NBC_00631 TaxID=2975793 RepID=UPI0030E302D1